MFITLVISLSYDHLTLWVNGGQSKSPSCLVLWLLHRYCGSVDIMILGCHVILRDYVIEEICNFMGNIRSR